MELNNRAVAPIRLVVDGAPMLYTLIENPIIDDVVITEARLQAASLMNLVDLSDHVVDRDIRNFLIQLGVER